MKKSDSSFVNSTINTLGRLAYSVVSYSALLTSLYGTSLVLNASRRNEKNTNSLASNYDLITQLRLPDGEQFSVSELLIRNSISIDNVFF